MILSIDFDGVIVEDKYPEIGKPHPGAIRTINRLYDYGHCIIINTCRARKPYEHMVKWLNIYGVKYCHINENCQMRIVKYGTDCRKISADLYIDDKQLITFDFSKEAPWLVIEKELMDKKTDECIFNNR